MFKWVTSDNKKVTCFLKNWDKGGAKEEQSHTMSLTIIFKKKGRVEKIKERNY